MFWIIVLAIVCVLIVLYALCRAAKNREELEDRLTQKNRRSHGA